MDGLPCYLVLDRVGQKPGGRWDPLLASGRVRLFDGATPEPEPAAATAPEADADVPTNGHQAHVRKAKAELAWLHGLQKSGQLSTLTAYRIKAGRMAGEDCDIVTRDQIYPALAHTKLWASLASAKDPALVLTPLADVAGEHTLPRVERLVAWLDRERPGWAFVMLSPYWIRWRHNSAAFADDPGVWVGQMDGWSGVSAYLVSPHGARLGAKYGVPVELSVDSIIRLLGTEGLAKVYGVVEDTPPRNPRLLRREPYMREHFVPLGDEPEVTQAPYAPVLPTLETLCVALLCTIAGLLVVLVVVAIVLGVKESRQNALALA